MPFDPTTGVFTRPNNSFSDPVVNTVIDPNDATALFDAYDGAFSGIEALPTDAENTRGLATWMADARYITDFGALESGVNDHATTNRIALQAAIDALPPQGGTVLVPNGKTFKIDGSVVLRDRFSIKIAAQGNAGCLFSDFSNASLILTATGNPLFVIDGCEGVEIAGLELSYDNPTYNGDLIDCRQQSGSILTTNVHIHHCRIGGIVGTSVGANSLIRTGNTLMLLIENGFINAGSVGLLGSDIGTATNCVVVRNIWFDGDFGQLPIVAGGGNWTVEDCIFERRQDGLAAAVQTTALGVACFNFVRNRCDDGLTTGTWVNINNGPLHGGQIVGNFFRNGARAISLGSSDNIDISGNTFYALESTPPVNPGTGTNLKLLGANYITTDSGLNVPALLSATPGAGSMWDNHDTTGAKFYYPLAVSTGGTGATTFTQHGVMLGAAQNPFNVTAVMSNGQLLVGQTGADPLPKTISGDATMSAAGALTVTKINGTTPTANILTFLATPSSANLAAALTDETGSGAAVFATSPTLTTPNIGAATGTSLNLSGLTASAALATDGSKNLVSVTNTGSGNNVLATTPTITNPNIVGTTTNDNAAAGSVGEYVSSTVISGSAVSLTTATPANVTNISLTAGDWDVSGLVGFLPANTTQVTQIVGSISTTSATLNTTPGNLVVLTSPATTYDGATQADCAMSPVRLSLASTTTVYLVAMSKFTVSTNGAFGIIRARRVR